MDVSIIVINYNTFELTCNCIQSVITYTSNITYEIILVDNGSAECDAELFKERFPLIHLIKSATNTGFAAGNNIGLKIAKGEIILLLNSDTELLENSIYSCYRFLKNKASSSVVSPMLIYPNGDIQHQCRRFPSLWLELIELFRLHKLLPVQKAGKLLLSTFFDHKTSVQPDWIWGTFFMFKRSVLHIFNDNLLPANFFMYGEDKQWCWEIRNHNGEIYYHPETKVIHHLSASQYNKQPLAKMRIIRQHEKELIKKYKGVVYWYTIKWIQLLKYIILWLTDRKYKKDIATIYSI